MNTPSIKPMLAAPIRPEKGESMAGLSFPLIASAKIDGIRCLVINGKAHSRSLKPIPNRHVSKLLSFNDLSGLDGELLIGDGSSFQKVTSGIMSHDGEPEFSFHVFDCFDSPNAAYEARIRHYHAKVAAVAHVLGDIVKAVPVKRVRELAELEDFTAECLAAGFEGAMVRLPHGPYKFGRATFKEGFLTKIKPFEDDEAEVVGFEEQMQNNNEATTNELGRTKRSSHQANKVGKLTLGALVLNHPKFGEFRCGTGFDDAIRLEIWNNMPKYFGKLVKFRYQVAGMKDKPRIPVFKAFRHEDDL